MAVLGTISSQRHLEVQVFGGGWEEQGDGALVWCTWDILWVLEVSQSAKNSDLTRLVVDAGIQTFLFLRHPSHCSDLRASGLSSYLGASAEQLVQPATADWPRGASLR